MGKGNGQFEEEEHIVTCKVCEEDILVDYYMDRGDFVTCEECDSEYVIKSLNPIVISLLEDDDEDEDDYDEDDYFEDDDYFQQDYDN